jgi:hypothetical protein
MMWFLIAAAVAWAFLSTLAWSRRDQGQGRVSERWLREHDGGWHPEG